MRSRICALVLLTLAAAMMGGCSSGAPSGAAPTTTATVEASATAESAAMNSSNPDPDSLLTVADVEKASGLPDLKSVAQGSTKEAIARLNFANADGTLVASLSIGDGTAFDQSLSTMNFAREATGTGSMSYVGPSPTVSPVLTIFAAAQGDHAIIMKTFLKTKDGTATWLSIEQLQQLTGLALSRWPS
jgi:hypothetical protein